MINIFETTFDDINDETSEFKNNYKLTSIFVERELH